MCPLRPERHGTERPLQNHVARARLAFVAAVRLLGGQLFASENVETRVQTEVRYTVDARVSGVIVIAPGAENLKGNSMDLRYPIGKYETKTSLTPTERAEAIAQIAEMPKRMRHAVGGLSGGQLDTPYRPGGWTVRQVAHHVPDSHMNAYIRLKLALTEHEPTIKPYEEGLWAELPDSRETPVEVSLALLEFLHLRWDILLRSLPPADFARRLRHPALGVMAVDNLVHLYAWHGRHHVAHITSLRQRESWN
jgi:hypothetical protein